MKSVIIITIAFVLLIPLSAHAQNETFKITDEVTVIVSIGNTSEISDKIDFLETKIEKLESKIHDLNQTITRFQEIPKDAISEIQEVVDTATGIVEFGDSVIGLIQSAVSLKTELLSGITSIETDITFALKIEDDEEKRESLQKVQDRILELKQEIQSVSLLESPDEIQSMIKNIHNKANSVEFELEETKNKVQNIENNTVFLLGQITEIKKQNDEMSEITESLKAEVQLLNSNLSNSNELPGDTIDPKIIVIMMIIIMATFVVGQMVREYRDHREKVRSGNQQKDQLDKINEYVRKILNNLSDIKQQK